MGSSFHHSDFERLFAQEASVRALARQLSSSEPEADDLAQELWLSLLKGGGGGARSVRAFLGGALRNLASKGRRRRARSATREAGAARSERLPSTATIVAREEWRRRVVERVLELHPAQREVVLLRYFEGWPPRRIARELGLSLEAVRSRLRRALAELRPRLVGESCPEEDRAGLALLALAPRASPTLPGTPTPFLPIVQTATKLAALVILAVGALAVAWRSLPDDRAGARIGALQSEHSLAAAEPRSEGKPHGGERTGLARRDAQEQASVASREVGARVSGRVVDERDWPVAGAEVLLWSSGVPQGAPLERVPCDSRGHFELERVPSPMYIEARAEASLPVVAARGAPAAGSTTEGIVLRVAAPLQHHVRVIAEGEPVSKAEIELAFAPLGAEAVSKSEEVFHVRPEGVSQVAWTAADGRALVAGLPSGEYSVVVRHPDYVLWMGQTRVDAERCDTLVELSAGCTIAGRVLDAAGDPVEGAQVAYRTRRVLGSARTDPGGRFRIAHVPATTQAWLCVDAQGHAPLVREPVEFRAGAAENLLLRLEEACSLAGIVRDVEGEALADVRVEIRGDRRILGESPRPLWSWPTWEQVLRKANTHTDGRGTFRIEDLYLGDFELALVWEENGTLRRTFFHARSGSEDLALVLDPEHANDVRFRGRVTDAVTGAPVERFRVTVLGVDEGGAEFNSMPIPTEHPDGCFRVGGLRRMQLSLFVSAPGYRDRGAIPELLESGEHQRDIALQPSRFLALRVVDARGEPVQSSVLVTGRVSGSLWLRLGEGGWSQSLTTNERGEILLQELPAEPVLVRVRSHDRAPLEVEFDLRLPVEGVQQLVVAPRE